MASRSPENPDNGPNPRKKERISHGLCHLSVNARGRLMSPAAPATTGAASATAAATAAGVSTDEFLQLLVAEIQNQDPTNPMDGTAFLTQLAQFQQVEQGVTLNTDVSGILTDTNAMAAADASATTAQS
jgi:flagellar basal-body rod modification protein FlgD